MGWVLDAVFPNGKQAAITGFRTESEANEWLGSAGHVVWLRGLRASFYIRAAVAAFACLDRCAAVSALATSTLVEVTWHRWGTVGAGCTGGREIRATLAQLHDVGRAFAIANLEQCSSALRMAARRGGLALWRHALYRRRLMTIAALLTAVMVLVFFGRVEHPPPSAAGAIPTNTGEQLVHSQSVEATEISDPIALLIERVTSSKAAADPPSAAAGDAPPPEPASAVSPEREVQDVTPRHDLRKTTPLAIVGVWAPGPGSCSARHKREGMLLAEISERGARAGETDCIFKKQWQTESDWRVLADCSNGRERWTANVRLTVIGDRLVWTSERGRQAYTRCKSNV
jgi:hypothetical protein